MGIQCTSEGPKAAYHMQKQEYIWEGNWIFILYAINYSLLIIFMYVSAYLFLF